MPAPLDPSRWEELPDGSHRRRRPDAPSAGEVPEPPVDLGLESIGAAHPPTMVEAAEVEEQDAEVDATEGALELADELGVDLGTVTGTGKDGRVTKADVEAAAS